MARPAKLKLWLLLGLVILVHFVVLEWFARERDQLTLMQAMAPPMFTRLLRQSAPPPVVASAAPAPPPPRSRYAATAVLPRPKASEPRPAAAARPRKHKAPARVKPQPPAEPAQARAPEPPPEPPVPAPPPPEPAPQVAAAPQATASAPQPPAGAASAAAPPASAASAAAADLGPWPPDTRLSYRLGGIYRGGPLFGDARVQWQREANKYQVRLDLNVKYFVDFTMTSQGEVTPHGLAPRAYEEYRPGKRRGVQFNENSVTLDNGKTADKPPGVQDTVSQFVELAHRFATGQEALEVGRTITVPLGRPGAVDLWTYDILEKEVLRTPKLGTVEAYHLKPRPLPNARGNYSADMWFAPSLQYLPVRIKVSMGEDDYVDILVDHIEQR